MITNTLTSNKQATKPETLSSDAQGSKKFMRMQDVFLRFQSKITSWSSDSIMRHYDTFDSEVLWIRWQCCKTGYVSLTTKAQAGPLSSVYLQLNPLPFGFLNLLNSSSNECFAYVLPKRKELSGFKMWTEETDIDEQAKKWLPPKHFQIMTLLLNFNYRTIEVISVWVTW